jgi:hypothetical protein
MCGIAAVLIRVGGEGGLHSSQNLSSVNVQSADRLTVPVHHAGQASLAVKLEG